MLNIAAPGLISNDSLFAAFQASIGIAVAAGAVVEFSEGRWAWRALGSRLTGSASPGSREREHILEAFNRTSLVGRLALGVPLACGLGGPLAAWLAVLLLTVALRLRFKHNMLYITLCAIVVAATETGRYAASASAEVPLWGPLSVLVLVFGLYLNGAWWKLKSVQFRSGATIYIILESFRHRRIGKVVNLLHTQVSPKNVRMSCRIAAAAVIGVEASLPVAFMIPALTYPGMAIGILLHAAFLIVQPGRLLPFQIAVVGSYACVDIVL